MEEQEMTKRERRALERQKWQTEEDRLARLCTRKTLMKKIFIGLVILAGIGGFSYLAAQPEALPANQDDILTLKEDDWMKGDRESKVTIIEYLDFECEACGAYYPLTKRLSEEFGDRMTLVIRYFPLPGHKNSQTSARAVEAAGKQGKYWEMYSILFENQSSWTEKPSADAALFRTYAERIGLNMEQYEKDIASEEVKDRIARDRSDAEKLDLQGTPSFFLNGKALENPRGYEDLKRSIEEALKN